MGARPSGCVVVEDTPSGVTAAVAAGMRVFGYAADSDEMALRHAGVEILRSLEDLPALLGSSDHARARSRAGSDITVGGAELAGEAIRAGLLDECHLLLVPVLVGAGKRSLPGGIRAQLHLLDEWRFGSGVVHLRYRI
jgi:dihydrofolate reductase